MILSSANSMAISSPVMQTVECNDPTDVKCMVAAAYTKYCNDNNYRLNAVNDHLRIVTSFDSAEVPHITIKNYINWFDELTICI